MCALSCVCAEMVLGSRTGVFRKKLSNDGTLSMFKDTLDLVQLPGLPLVLAPSSPADTVIYDDEQIQLEWVACFCPAGHSEEQYIDENLGEIEKAYLDDVAPWSSCF